MSTYIRMHVCTFLIETEKEIVNSLHVCMLGHISNKLLLSWYSDQGGGLSSPCITGRRLDVQ